MAMNGIDISSHNAGINLAGVPSDFVIVKATQGRTYVSPSFTDQITQTMNLGKLAGIYHYIGGQNAQAEAQHFVDVVKPYLRKAILCLDWESIQNAAWGNTSYLTEIIRAVKNLTGINPLIYASLAVYPWDVVRTENCGAWVAQYANTKPTGYQQNPFNENAYTCAIRQYTDAGQLANYNGPLDLDKAYMDAATWMKYADPSGTASLPTATSTSTDVSKANLIDLVIDTMEGKFGNGEARKQALGDRYNEVQSLINHLSSADAKTLAAETWEGKYGNGEKRKALFDAFGRYNEIMNEVNKNGGSSTT